MILVLTGTHHQPFDRLVRAAPALAAATGERVVVQRGASRVEAPGCEVVDVVPPERLAALADEARVVVAHAGPGSLFLAWDRGRVPIVVPRRPELGEHVDDHQVRFARWLGDRAVVVEDPADLPAALMARRDVLEAGLPPPSPGQQGFPDRFAALVDEVVRRRREAPGLRGRLRSILLRLGSTCR